MFSKVNSMGLQGFSAELVIVEADLSSGLPRFDLVGLPTSAVSESKERVRSAIKNCGMNFPISRITINLAPADFRKEGPIYDLPILISILLASGQLKATLSDSVLLGEVSLNGELRQINGVLPMLIKAKDSGIKKAFIPIQNSAEASLVVGLEVYPIASLSELLNHINGTKKIEKLVPLPFNPLAHREEILDFADVRGQQAAKRALEVAAAGGHNILMVGPPGSGKSMLAKRLPSILPDMTYDESINTTAIYSVAGEIKKDTALITTRPFRAPHHTATAIALSGGGSRSKPGEISLAHNGVLFLDELTMFSRNSLEVLRQPLEDNVITISRNSYTVTYPSSIMLVCAMNPCPCGYLTDPNKSCTCSEKAKRQYLAKISGPLLDRLDIHIQVAPVNHNDLMSFNIAEHSSKIKERVDTARRIQIARFENQGVLCNAKMTPDLVHEYCKLSSTAEHLLSEAFNRIRFSARANDKILKTARTIADLDSSEIIEATHIAEAIQYRSMDRII